MKLMVIGHGRHGKDTVASLIQRDYGLNFVSSSFFMAERVLYPYFQKQHPGLYTSIEECYEDRHQHRALWFDKICEFNEKPVRDMARLGNLLFSEYDIYCGIRNKNEFHALRNGGSFDAAIWVDRSDHLPREPESSMTIKPWMADFIIDNNGTEADLEREVKRLMENVLLDKR